MPDIPPLLGRETELAVIADAIARAAAGKPSLVIVEGEPGSGRTALLDALETSPLLPRRKIQVTRLDIAKGGDTDVVADAAGRLTRHQTNERLGGRRRLGAAIRRVLPDWMGAIPVWGDLLEAITTTANVVRRRKKDPADTLPEDIAALHRVARRRPTAVLVDDAHRLGPLAADRLLRLVGAADVGTRLLVLATARSAAPGAPPAEIIRPSPRIPTERRQRILLGPLDEPAVRTWTQRFLGGDVDDSVIADVLESTGGLAAAIATRLDALRAAGTLRRDGERWTLDTERPPPVQEETPVDFGLLGADVVGVLGAAATLDDPFDALTLAQSVGRDELWVEDRLAAARRLGVLECIDDSHEVDGEITSVYRFVSAATRAALRRQAHSQRTSR